VRSGVDELRRIGNHEWLRQVLQRRQFGQIKETVYRFFASLQKFNVTASAPGRALCALRDAAGAPMPLAVLTGKERCRSILN
jgi:hypothetical protein